MRCAAARGVNQYADGMGTDASRIGWAFISQYYTFLNRDPARLHCFYTKRSVFIHGTESVETLACYGQKVSFPLFTLTLSCALLTLYDDSRKSTTRL